MAKRISSSSIDWNIVMKIPSMPIGDKVAAFKSKSDKFARRVVDNPGELPKIDWSYYQSKISIPGMVEGLKKGYEGLKLPYPTDQGLLAIIDKEEETYSKLAQVEEERKAKTVNEWKEKLAKLEKEIPLSEMTIEEFFLARPEYAFDPNNPKAFPQFINMDKVDNDKS